MTIFKKGDKVKIYNYTAFTNKRFFEGIATVDKKADYGDTHYNVCFESGHWCVRNLREAELVK